MIVLSFIIKEDIFLFFRKTTVKSFQVNSTPQPSKKPLSVLQKSISKSAAIRLKNEIEYRGKVSNVDPYMNVILTDAEEYENGKLSANYGKVVIRGNNVLYIRLDDSL
jgi:small nuclear ribonucleoprotein